MAASACGVAACGSSSKSGGTSSGVGNTLTIYSSLPLQGASRDQNLSVVNGEKLALADAGGAIGKFKINFVSLDDSTAQNAGNADPAKTAQNAREAVRDKSTIFYLGEFNSGGTKVSLPILNQANIPQISPSNTYPGLTVSDPPGTEAGEPAKYYPTGVRTYARVVPKDEVQAAALVTTMNEDGCKTATLWDDKTTYGAGLARFIQVSAKKAGPTLENIQHIDLNSPNYRSIASKVKSDCFVFAGVTASNAVQAFKDVAQADPTAKLYGPDGVTDDAFVDPKKGGLPAAIGARTKITTATLGIKDLPEAAAVLANYKKTYNATDVPPYAIYGYETMSLALDSIKRAGAKGNDRAAVLKALFATKDKKGVIGTYSIDANGDTTLTDYGLYVIKNGALVYSKKIVAAT